MVNRYEWQEKKKEKETTFFLVEKGVNSGQLL